MSRGRASHGLMKNRYDGGLLPLLALAALALALAAAPPPARAAFALPPDARAALADLPPPPPPPSADACARRGPAPACGSPGAAEHEGAAARAASPNATALLWTIEGSGNTWTRLLLEAAANDGRLTGDIYFDPSLFDVLPGTRAKTNSRTMCAQFIAIKAHPHPPTGRRKTRSGLVNPVTGRFDELRVCNGEVDRALVVTRDPLRSVKAEASRQVSSGLFDQHARAVMFTPGLKRTLPLVAKELALAMEPTWRRGEGMFADLVGASGAADRDKPLAEREDVMVMRFEDIASKEPGVREAALGAALRFVGVCPSAEQLRCAFIDPRVTREKRAQHNGTVTAAWPPPEGAANVDAAVQSFLEYFGGPRGPLARAMSSSSFSSKGEAKLGIFSARHMRLATILALRTEAKLLIEAKYKPLTVEDAACAVAATLEETLWSMPGGDDWRALGYERTPVQPLEGRVQHLPRRRRARGRAGGPAATSAP